LTPIETAQQENRAAAPRAVTTPVTFHLPVELRDKLKLTAQAKQKTMVEIAIEALRTYLEKNPVSESDLRRMLGL
jgi:predicted transcriptional regulator